MGHDYPFPEFPNGWFVIGLSGDLSPGQVRPIHYLGRDLVLYRTEQGEARVIDAHCPHLGAHFGHGGAVRGDRIRCPFHGWCFDGAGRCVEAPFVERIPRAARARAWPVHESDGLVHLFHHARGEAPDWLPPARLGEGWTSLETVVMKARFHPQEIAENTIDATHAVPVHGFLEPNSIADCREEGPFWTATWTIKISAEYALAQLGGGEANLNDPVAFAGQSIGTHETAMVQTMSLRCVGLGITEVAHDLVMLGWPSLVRFCVTPIGGGEVEFRVVTCLRPPPDADPTMVENVGRHLLTFTLHDARQDVEIFQHKKYLTRPAIAPSDGPVMRLRRWTRQFYSGLPVLQDTPAPEPAAADSHPHA